MVVYTIGLALAVILTATSFGSPTPRCSGDLEFPSALPCVPSPRWEFTSSSSTGPDNTNNVLALAFGVLIVTLVVAGSLWIMTNLNDNMVPPASLNPANLRADIMKMMNEKSPP